MPGQPSILRGGEDRDLDRREGHSARFPGYSPSVLGIIEPDLIRHPEISVEGLPTLTRILGTPRLIIKGSDNPGPLRIEEEGSARTET